MNNLEGIDIDELHSQRSLLLEEQDLRLLKALVSDSNAAREIANSCPFNVFISDARNFAKNAIEYYKEYGAVPTKRVMLDQAENNPNYKEEVEYIWDKLENISYQPNEFEYDLDKARHRYSRKKIQSLKESIELIDYNSIDFDETIRSFKSTLDDADKIRKGGDKAYVQKTIKEYMPDFRKDFIRKANDEDFRRGIMSGYSFLDYVTNGLSPADLWIIGGETGSGKSMLLSNMAVQVWLQQNNIHSSEFTKGYNVLYFSLEMPFDQCVRRTIARLTDISTYALRDANVKSEEKIKALSQSACFIDNYPHEFEVVDIPRGVTVSHIEESFNESVARGIKPDVVFVDYLGLMEDSDAYGDDWLKLGYIAGKLHEFARVYNVPVVTAVQLNRPKGKDPEDIIGLHRIGRSSLIMHHATVGIQIETRINEEQFSDMIYHIIKNRNGERGQHSLMKNFKSATLKDLEMYQPQIDDVGEYTSINQFVEDISDKLARFGWTG